MTGENSGLSRIAERRSGWADMAREGPLHAYLDRQPVLEIGSEAPAADEGGHATVMAIFRLQDVADYRAALRAWFRPLAIGGHLVVVVPHAFLHERQLALPSRWSPRPRRLYTPRSLLEEVEEALVPNSYRVRHLADLDEGYDYALGDDQLPVGHSDIVLVVEKIEPPDWPLALVPQERAPAPRPATPDYAFEPPRTRVETAAAAPPRRILILKLDHLGDLIMAMAALERARRLFADAEITLVVGSWNLDMARAMGVADHVIGFDVFPRNSTEEDVDVAGKAALFQATVGGEYDLAIDLRNDTDTRQLLRLVKAERRAGIGTRGQFPFLDIFLPLDFNRNEPESAREYQIDHHAFAAQGPVVRREHRLLARAADAERHCAILWGPYWALRPGPYLFDAHIEFGEGGGGLLLIDVALDAVRVAQAYVDGPGPLRLAFAVEKPDARFEFRVWTVDDAPALDFSFYGGRLIRAGGGSVLHQSEYAALLIELVAMRLGRAGILADLADEPFAALPDDAATA